MYALDTTLLTKLPPPIHEKLVGKPVPMAAAINEANMQMLSTTVPPYGKRKGWIPRTEKDFGDGGAFPEIHVAQHPLGMGLKTSGQISSNALAMQVDSEGKVRYDVLARHGHAKDRVVHTKYEDLLPKNMEDLDLAKPPEEEVEETFKRTQDAFARMIQEKLAAAAPVKGAQGIPPAKYIRYTPAQQMSTLPKQRIIRMVESQVDPMEPPRFKINAKIPRGPPSPPAPVLHSPSRKLSAKEQAEWKIPVCVSNWKNPRGYTIPLDKRVAADGRGLQQVHINENFSKLAEALQIAERKARDAVEMRIQQERRNAQLEKEKKEEELQKIARQAREGLSTLTRKSTTTAAASNYKEDLEIRERDELRRERNKDRVRQRNLARASGDTRARVQKELDRDISEKIALGLPARGNAGGTSLETQFDQRLFNQTRGLDSGFSGGADDLYNVYDQPWRTEKETAGHLYRPTKQKENDHATRGPVEFTRDDPFNITQFLKEVKKTDKRPAPSSRSSGATTNKKSRD